MARKIKLVSFFGCSLFSSGWLKKRKNCAGNHRPGLRNEGKGLRNLERGRNRKIFLSAACNEMNYAILIFENSQIQAQCSEGIDAPTVSV